MSSLGMSLPSLGSVMGGEEPEGEKPEGEFASGNPMVPAAGKLSAVSG